MTSRDFCFWLQGHLEMSPGQSMDSAQVEMMRKHLALVFVHEIDPSMKTPEPKTEHETKLDSAHGGGDTSVFRC
jgi:hypothetical protein